jgi:hypothetical protein
LLVSQAFRQEKYLARIRESSVSEDPDDIRFYASRSSIELFLEDGYEISHLTLISTNRRTFGQEWQAAAELLRFHETLKNMSEAMLEAIIRTMRFCGESGPDAPLDVIMPASDNACCGFLHDLAVACRSSVKIDPVSGTRTIVRTSKTELCSLSKLLMLSAMHLDRILRKRSILYRAFCEVITGPDPVKAGCAKAVARTLGWISSITSKRMQSREVPSSSGPLRPVKPLDAERHCDPVMLWLGSQTEKVHGEQTTWDQAHMELLSPKLRPRRCGSGTVLCNDVSGNTAGISAGTH